MDINNIETYLNNKTTISILLIIILLAGIGGYIIISDSIIKSPDETFDEEKNKSELSLHGSVYVNDKPVSDATVELYNENGLVNSTMTDSNGNYSFNANSGLISVSIQGEHKIGDTKYHGGDYKYAGSNVSNVKFEFISENGDVARINGTNRLLDYQGSENGDTTDKVISDVYMLQGVVLNKSDDYELTRNINAEETTKWYKYNDTVDMNITKDIMKTENDNWLEKIDMTSFYDLDEEVSNPQNVDYEKHGDDSIIVDLGSNPESYNYPITIKFKTYDNIYNGFKPIGDNSNPFLGNIDGNGFEVRNVHIERAENYVGIIGYNKGNISNIGVNQSSITGNNYGGGITGYNEGSIKTSYTITEHNMRWGFGSSIGGIAGQNEGNIDTVYADFTSNVYNGHGRAAAISGAVESGSINNAYFRSNGEYEYEATTEYDTTRFDTEKVESLRYLDDFDYDQTWYSTDEYSKLKIRPVKDN